MTGPTAAAPGRLRDAARFGVCVPTFAAMGAGLFRVPGMRTLDPSLPLELASEAEDLGFDSVWVPDHYMIGRDRAVLDGLTTLSAIAGATRRVRLGLIQQSLLFRHPPQLAKMAATLDQLSGGRLTLFTSFGRARAEHVAYGFPWPEPEADRIARFREAIDLMHQLWRAEAPVTVRGRAVTVVDAVCRPPPRQTQGPPLWFAGSEPDILQLCAEVGQGWNTTPVTLAELRERHAVLIAACAAVGRPADEIEVSLETQILIGTDLADIRSKITAMIADDPQGTLADRPPLLDATADAFLRGETDELPSPLGDRWIVGTPGPVAARLHAYIASGVSHFLLWLMDLPDRTSLRLLARALDGR